jgi:hypothetical protein
MQNRQAFCCCCFFVLGGWALLDLRHQVLVKYTGERHYIMKFLKQEKY